MADAMTTTASTDFDQAMWDKRAYLALRPELYFDAFADVKPGDTDPNNGSSITFTTANDLAAATTPLNESVDVDAVAISDVQVTLTLAEYGNSTNSTWRVRATAFIDVNPVIANLIGYNAGLSMDILAANIMKAGSNVRYAGQAVSRATVIPTDKLTGNNVRRAKAELQGANVQSFNGYYAAIIHPDVAYDLQGETGGTGWRDPHVYSQPGEIWNGEIGAFESFRFMTSPRSPLFSDAGSSTTLTDVYGTLFFGRQALAKAFTTFEGRGPQPIVIKGPIVDKLMRFQPLSWHHWVAYGRFREAALRRVESASTIGTNS
jgi:N4-gp56 family major capsid protein